MSVICPAILAVDQLEYIKQLDNVDFASRLHIDFMDGTMSDSNSIKLEQASWNESVQADLHIMYERPDKHLEVIETLKPNLVIIHAESGCDIREFVEELIRFSIKVGLAILPETSVDSIEPFIDDLDHVLIFSGHLGHFGGKADLSQLNKIRELKLLNPDLEIGWDGGVNDQNIKQISEAGVDVINVGGYIQKSDDPYEAYLVLAKAID